MERCEVCPIKEKVALYKQAGKDRDLAVKLATEQRIIQPIDLKDPTDLFFHFDKTADTILIGCRTQILCRVNAR